MPSDAERQLVVSLIKAAGKVSGRSHLHRMVYLMQMFGFDLGFTDFTLVDDFGPHSRDLAYHIQGLITEGLVKADRQEIGDDARGIPRYIQILTVEHKLPDEYASTVERVFSPSKSVREFWEHAKELADIESAVLDMAALAVYLHDLHITEEAGTALVQRRSHKVTKEQMGEAQRLFNEWRAKHYFK